MEALKSLANPIRQARKARGESQADLARRLGVSQQQISRIETGHGSFDQVVQLCRALGTRLDIRLGEHEHTIVYPLDPEERREIEANIDWFSRLTPLRRLRVIEDHLRAARRLQGAAHHAR